MRFLTRDEGLFELIDQDGNGSVCFSEFLKAAREYECIQESIISTERLQYIFDLYDYDEEEPGYLPRKQFIFAWKQVHREWRDKSGKSRAKAEDFARRSGRSDKAVLGLGRVREAHR